MGGIPPRGSWEGGERDGRFFMRLDTWFWYTNLSALSDCFSLGPDTSDFLSVMQLGSESPGEELCHGLDVIHPSEVCVLGA